ncbi:MAG: hypothetical protein FJ276_33670, partial [Planctomycetes bacterium]|nr:hypothetical protein [Planctomycetota bacterium]
MSKQVHGFVVWSDGATRGHNMRNAAFLALVLVITAFTSQGRADVGASAISFIAGELGSIARQYGKWTISDGPNLNNDGSFGVTFRNEIKYLGGYAGQKTWVEIKGNARTGEVHVLHRGGNAVTRAMVSSFKVQAQRMIPRLRATLAQSPPQRTIVFPSGGRVRKQANGSWIEHGADGRFVCRFREI